MEFNLTLDDLYRDYVPDTGRSVEEIEASMKHELELIEKLGWDAFEEYCFKLGFV